MFDVLEEIRDLMETNIGAGFNQYWVGKLETPPINYLPVLTVYGSQSQTVARNTCEDRDVHTVTIELFSSSFGQIQNAQDADKVQMAQKELYDLMEERDSNGVALNTTVLGVLRRNIKGTTFLFTNDYSIDYDTFKVSERTFFKSTLTVAVNRPFVNRS